MEDTSPSPAGHDLSSSAGEMKSELSSSASEQAKQLSSDDEAKISRILSACRDHDLEALCELACSEGGFIVDDVRRTACEQIIPWVTLISTLV